MESAMHYLKQGNEFTEPPIIRAARSPDPSVLRLVLDHGKDKLDPHGKFLYGPDSQCDLYFQGHCNSPLTTAIRAGLNSNVKILLESGADPNGVQISTLESFSRFFVREFSLDTAAKHVPGRMTGPSPTRRELISWFPEAQLSPVSKNELSKRGISRNLKPVRFWSDEGFPYSRPGFPQNMDACPITALEAAAESGDLGILEEIASAQPDMSHWASPNGSVQEVPEPPTHSSLATSSPLHRAIRHGHLHILQRLLQLRLNPNIFPAATPTCAITPLIATITDSGPDGPNMAAFDLIFRESFHKPDLSFRTPIFDVHVLHFATASLSLSCLKHVAAKVPLSSAGCTSIGHTLLHIATLPLDESEINFHSAAILRSVHDVRTLSFSWKPEPVAVSFPSPVSGDDRTEVDILNDDSKLSRPQDTSFFAKQVDVVRYLLVESENGRYHPEARKVDIYGNTPLHYAAAYRTVNMDLLDLLVGSAGGKEAWMEVRNNEGFTPHDLLERGLEALERVG
ncbi:hypothetical protein FQN54_008840 [Arachnomyces sp. PD_36]|nr:hypothetical protein FQN54_008840 [Arachnomyces sp. PD_36]